MLDQFTNQYSLSKTLRFGLRPVGERAGYLDDFKSQYLRDVVRRDEIRAGYYEKIKVIIDKYHKEYIDQRYGHHLHIINKPAVADAAIRVGGMIKPDAHPLTRIGAHIHIHARPTPGCIGQRSTDVLPRLPAAAARIPHRYLNRAQIKVPIRKPLPKA